jgi:hypothetical protein
VKFGLFDSSIVVPQAFVHYYKQSVLFKLRFGCLIIVKKVIDTLLLVCLNSRWLGVKLDPSFLDLVLSLEVINESH